MAKIKVNEIALNHIHKCLFQPCEIVPLESLNGVIVAINFSKKGTELQVRYFIDGEYRVEWFYDFDLVVYDNPSFVANEYEKQFFALMPLISNIYNRIGGMEKLKGVDYGNVGLYKIDKLDNIKGFLLKNIKYRSQNYDLKMTQKSKVYDELLDMLKEIEL